MRVRQAVIMVGGQGTRLRPLTESCPKPILPVAGRPCIWYLMRSMARAGIEEIILACGYRPEMMEGALGDGSDLGIKISYSYESEPMGTGGALKLVEDRLDPVFLASNGDVFADIDLRAEIDRHLDSGAEVTVALASVPNPWEFGVARVADDGSILEFREGMKEGETFSDQINAGVYVADKNVLERIPAGRFCDFSKEIFPEIISSGGKLMGYPLDGIWMDVGRPSDYVKANLCMASREPGDSSSRISGGSSEGPVFVGEGAFAKDSDIDSAVLMGGAEVVGSRLRRAVVLSGSRIEGADVEDSIIGRGCRVCAGAVVRNSVLADGDVVGPGEKRDDGRKVRSDLFRRFDRVPDVHVAVPGFDVFLRVRARFHLQAPGIKHFHGVEAEVADHSQRGFEDVFPVPRRDVVVELLLHVAFAYVNAGPLLEEILFRLRASVIDDRIGGIGAFVPRFLEIHPDDVLVRLLVQREARPYVAESYQFPDLRIDHGEVVVHAPQHMDGEPDSVLFAVGRHWVASDHAHLLVFERFHEMEEGFVGPEDVVCVQHDDQSARFRVKISVYGGILPFPSVLDDEIDVFMLFLELADDVVGPIRASA